MAKVRIAKPNFTQVPNAILALMAEMSECELRVVIAVCRKTFGWQKMKDKISITQIESMTGLSRQGVINGIKQATERGIIEREKNGLSFLYSVAVFGDDETSQPGIPEEVNVVDQIDPKLVNVVDTQKKVLKERKETIPAPSAERNWRFPIALAYEEVCNCDLSTNRQRIFREIKYLAESNHIPRDEMPALIREKFGPGGWWYQNDWRGKKGQHPSVTQVREVWREWEKQTVKTGIMGTLQRWGLLDGKSENSDSDLGENVIDLSAEHQ